MAIAFNGGVHPPDHKEETQSVWIEKVPIPKKVIVPLSMHIGAPAKPLVKVKDEVRTGQKIGDSSAFISASVHAPITGTVTAINEQPHPIMGKSTAITIEGDGFADIPYYLKPEKSWEEMSIEEIISLVKDTGIVGLGGAAFPTHIKLCPPKGTKIDTLIINGAECEPYLASDDRLMREKPNEVLEGIRILKKVTGAKDVILGIEDNKHLASKAISQVLESNPIEPIIKKVILKTRYPQGSEKQLIQALTGKEVPSGGLPSGVGVVVQNISTAYAIYDAIVTGKPLIERVVTVAGDGIKNPGNFLVRLGTPFSTLIEKAGGFKGEPGKILMGGPMMGIAQYTINTPVIKGSSGILVFNKNSSDIPDEQNCIRCSFCIKACPQKLMPQMLAKLAKKEMWTTMKYEYNMMDCMECGSCSYSCPAKIPIVQYIRLGKYRARALKI